MKIDPDWEHLYLYLPTNEICYPEHIYCFDEEMVHFPREFDPFVYVKSKHLKKKYVIEQPQPTKK